MSRISELPQRTRGSYLDRCQKVSLLSNLFKVDFKETLKVYIYSVKTLPEIPQENGKKLKSIILCNRLVVERVVGPHVVSGRTIFGTRGQAGKQQFKVSMEHESVSYQVLLKLVKQITLSDVSRPQKQSSAIVYSFLNSMVRNFFHQMQYTEIGRSRKYFDPQSRKELSGANVAVYHGYSTNFCLLEGGLFLKVDPTVKIVQSESALDLINKIYKINSALSKTEKRALVEHELINKTVMANYGKNRCYRIQAVSFDTNLETFSFTYKDKTINIIQYYTRTYDVLISSKKQPLLQAVSNQSRSGENKEIIYLVPELVLMGGLPQDFDQRKRKEVSDTTIVAPLKKLEEIQDLFNKMSKVDSDYNPKTIAQKLGINFKTTPASITAKQLQPPELQLGDRERVDEFKATNFMLFNKYINSREHALKISVFYPDDFAFAPLRKLMESTCHGLGLKHYMFMNPVNYGDYKLALKHIEKCVRKESEEKTSNVCWFIIPPSFRNHYKSLKRMCVKEGVEMNSQATITTNLLKKNSASIFTKILLQMTAKIGNKLWVPKVSQKIASAGVLLIGLEFTKDSECKDKTIVSYCSNSNKDFSSFYSKYIIDDSHALKTYMKEIIFDCLNQYMLKNQSPPTDVLIIKNGTIKMDQAASIQAEVVETKEILKSVSKNHDPIRLTYIMLDKNSSQKFFLEKGDNILNPNSGTLINSEAVGKNFEFYLVAQQCNRGTVKPTYYKVAYSDSTLEEGVIEQLIYSQCFNYMNWSGSIKIPSTLQYAKKLGMFAGQYLNREVKLESLERNLYYI